MKFQLIFLSLLIAACSAKSIGGSSEMSIEGMMGSFDPIEILEDFKKTLKEECRNYTGSDEAYNSIQTKPDEFFTCLVGSIDIEEIMAEFEKVMQTEKYDPLFNKACSTIRDIIPCVEYFAKSLEVCMDEEEKQLSDLALIVIKASVNYICNKNIEELEAIFEAPSDECITSKADEIEECANSTLIKYFTETDDKDIFDNVHKLLTEEEGCSDLMEFQTCTIASFNECENKQAIGIGSDFIDALIEKTPCKDFKKNFKSVVGNDL